MKRLLLLSLVANAALAGALVWITQKPSAAGIAPTQTQTDATGTAGKPITAPDPAPSQAQPVMEAFDWRAVESEDYKKYIANLRSIGCPEETIRDIIIADVNKLYEARRKELSGATNKFQFWKTGNMFADMMNPERIEQGQALMKEKRALLKELLGVEPEAQMMDMFSGMNPFENMLDFLSPSQQTQAMEIYTKYQAKLAKTFSGGAPDAMDMKEMLKMQSEMDAELAQILSPQEFEEYQLRMSMTAMTMRMQLGSFDPTEQEFRDIFKVRKAFDDQYSLMGMPTPGASREERERIAAARKEMDTQIEQLLGNRYPDYQRAQDWNYQAIYRVTERNGLPKQTAVQVYDMKKAAEDQARGVRQDTSLTPEQRNASLSIIRTQTENAMRGVMGQTAFDSYIGQARWLDGISRTGN